MGCYQSKELPIQPVIALPINLSEPSSNTVPSLKVGQTEPLVIVPSLPNSFPIIESQVILERKNIEVLFCASNSFSKITPMLGWNQHNLHLTAFGTETDYAKDITNHCQYYFEEFLYDGKKMKNVMGNGLLKIGPNFV